MTVENSNFARSKLVIERMYAKIDYLKNARLRIPAFVAAANFALLTVFTRAEDAAEAKAIFVIGLSLIGIVGALSMNVVRSSFSKNVNRLKSYYKDNEIDPDLAEPATEIWFLLFSLILIACLLPIGLVLFVDFLPMSGARP